MSLLYPHDVVVVFLFLSCEAEDRKSQRSHATKNLERLVYQSYKTMASSPKKSTPPPTPKNIQKFWQEQEGTIPTKQRMGRLINGEPHACIPFSHTPSMQHSGVVSCPFAC
jgi:hypothetical protein